MEAIMRLTLLRCRVPGCSKSFRGSSLLRLVLTLLLTISFMSYSMRIFIITSHSPGNRLALALTYFIFDGLYRYYRCTTVASTVPYLVKPEVFLSSVGGTST